MKRIEHFIDSDIGFRIIRGITIVWFTVLIVFVLTVIISIENKEHERTTTNR